MKVDSTPAGDDEGAMPASDSRGAMAAGGAEVASGYKIAAHRDRVVSYLSGERIYPVCLELDLTSRCSRACRDCPSTRASEHWELSPAFLDRLFDSLQGKVTGLLLTGGEPTLSPLFVSTLALARRSGFREIAVVTNGSHLDREDVCAALRRYASSVRVSLYDWEEGVFSGAETIFGRLEGLRRSIDAEGAALRIGVSALTSATRLERMRQLAAAAAASGVHWLYFHPRCRHWDEGRPEPEPQDGVLEEIARLQDEYAGRLEIDVSVQRYQDFTLDFSAYHAAHFMMVVGADGKNYLAAEVKYHPDFVIADLKDGNGSMGGPHNGFLWAPERLRKIAEQSSASYRAIGSRHRGVLYNNFIQRLLCDDIQARSILDSEPRFSFPHIL
jgi:MoaA/NifB/PqqE/SkfB family radical SAM enzyme